HFLAEHVRQILRRPPRLDVEQRVDAAEHVHELSMFVHQETWRHEAIEQAIVHAEELRADTSRTRRQSTLRAYRRAAARNGQFQIAGQPDVAPFPINPGAIVDGIELVEQAAWRLA